MTQPMAFTLDGSEVAYRPGQTIIQAALAAGRYIPHLCYHPEFKPHGSCKLCTVKVDGRHMAACTTPAAPGIEVASDTQELNDQRRTLVQMLFVEGNHFCPSCETSGECMLQAVAYDLGVMSPRFPHLYPNRPVDASHPDILLDFDRCILCELCIRASAEVDRKNVFALSGRGITKHLIVNAASGRLADTNLAAADKAAHVCPGRRDPAQAAGVRGADRQAQVRREADQRPGAGGRAAPAGSAPWMMRSPPSCESRRPRWLAASAATCRCWTSTSGCSSSPQLVEFDRSPLTDIKRCGRCDIGLIEGGICNAENVHVLREFRANCKILIAIGACALNGGLPAQRNHLDLRDCLQEVYATEASLGSGGIPNDPELPLPLDKVHPLHEVVKIDYFLPGCPPSADAIWKFFTDLLAGRTPRLGHELMRYD